MLQPSFTITTQDERADFARLILEPLEQGFGHTMGVSLRRILLSSIQGAAVSKVIIEGVQHQFTTLEGMSEDITELILNIKGLNFRIEDDSEEVTVKLSAKGGLVTGKDITLPPNVMLANPEHELAHLAAKKSLDAELTITRGRGYSLASDRISNTLGEIPVDASYSPIKKVAYKVEATRVGRRTDFDKLILDIWTDGTLAPRDALEKAASILVTYAQQVYDPIVVQQPKQETFEDRIENEVLKLTVEELDLPTRIANALRKGGYPTVKDLTLANKDDISKVKNLGGKSVETVADALAQKGLVFAGEAEIEVEE